VTRITDGQIELVFQEPGAIVPALEVFDAVGTGAVEAGWSTPGYWAGRVPALQLAGGRAVRAAGRRISGLGEVRRRHRAAGRTVRAAQHPRRSTARSSHPRPGWFRQPIESPADFQGLTMRFFGLGAKVMEKMGTSTQLLAGGDIFPALELGTIDATEFSMPAIDLNLGFYQVASHYYFPGWHQQSTLFDLMINLDLWESLDEATQFKIETVCDANIAYGLAEGEALQFDALRQLEENGVTIHTYSDEILDALESAWLEVVEEESANDADFARTYESYATFRENYRRWGELGYLR
jgi:TRAP-type mannitol/chloroaromatic compound transport system substrate-binding protein